MAKQMCIAGDMERVYEIAPGQWTEPPYSMIAAQGESNADIMVLQVFRAEDSNTARHMTEFVGLDLEMAIEEHYHEVVDLLDSLLLAIFQGLKQKYSHEIDVIRKQFPCEDFLVLDETLRLPFKEGMRMLREAGATDVEGAPIGDMDDMR